MLPLSSSVSGGKPETRRPSTKMLCAFHTAVQVGNRIRATIAQMSITRRSIGDFQKSGTEFGM